MGLKPKLPGLIKGLGVTFNTMVTTITKGANTVQYPHEKVVTFAGKAQTQLG